MAPGPGSGSMGCTWMPDAHMLALAIIIDASGPSAASAHSAEPAATTVPTVPTVPMN